jgi:hypothetical protein
MTSESRLFGLVSAFLFVAAAVYAFWTKYSLHGVEWIGVTALVLSGMLTTMCTLYFFVVSRRIDPRPEDDPHAEISDAAGDVGFFSPGSYWPFGLALSALVAGLGLVYWQVWLLIVGLVAVLGATGGLLFEYYSGARRAAE